MKKHDNAIGLLNVSSTYTMEDMERVRNGLQKRVDAIQAIIDGGTLGDAAKILGKTKASAAAYISRVIRLMDVNTVNPTEDQPMVKHFKYNAVWPENLYCAILNVHEYAKIPLDAEKAIEHVLSKLTERESILVKKYYEDGLSLEAISKLELFSCSRNNVQQIKNRILRKMRHPLHLRCLTNGFDVYKRMEEVEAKERAILDDKATWALELEIKEKFKNIRRNNISLKAIAITDINSSQRVINALLRAGIRTVYDLVSKSEREVREISGLGRKSFKELKETLTKMKLHLNK